MTANINDWLRDATGGASLRAMALKIGMPVPTLTRQSRATFQPATIVEIARAYDANPLEGLEALGLLTKKDLRAYRSAPDWRSVSDRELLDELERRLRAGQASDLLTSGDIEPAPREPLRLVTDDAPTDALDLPYAAGSSRDTGEEGDTP